MVISVEKKIIIFVWVEKNLKIKKENISTVIKHMNFIVFFYFKSWKPKKLLVFIGTNKNPADLIKECARLLLLQEESE